MAYKSDFKERLGELLFENCLTVNGLAEKIGVSSSSVYRWLKNPMQISMQNFVKVADLFCCSLDYLAGKTDIFHKVSPKPLYSFGKRMREIIEEKGISQYKLRKISRFESIYFQKWDRGESPGLSVLIELSELLDCSLDYLAGRI